MKFIILFKMFVKKSKILNNFYRKIFYYKMKKLLKKKNFILSILYNFFKFIIQKKSTFRVLMFHNVSRENFSIIKKPTLS